MWGGGGEQKAVPRFRAITREVRTRRYISRISSLMAVTYAHFITALQGNNNNARTTISRHVIARAFKTDGPYANGVSAEFPRAGRTLTSHRGVVFAT